MLASVSTITFGNNFDEANCNYTVKMRKLIYIITIITIVSCSGKEQRPKGILSEEKMAVILSDIYYAEYKAANINISPDSSKTVLRHYELKIFKDHNTTDSIYKESFPYSLDHPAKLESVYDIVIDTISLREQVESATKK